MASISSDDRVTDMRSGTVVLTGATSGIGEATALRLAGLASTLILLGPETEAGASQVLMSVRAAGPARVHYVSADFTRCGDVVAAARQIKELGLTIDLLINNAGVPGAPVRTLTPDGFERTLQVNALAPALLTRLLASALARRARIVNVGSSAHRFAHFALDDPDIERDYTPTTAYCRAKLAMVTWSSLLAGEFAGTDVNVVALCPGLTSTQLSAAMAGPIGSPPSDGARRVLGAAVADIPSGSYLENHEVVPPSPDVRDPANRAALTRLYLERLTPYAAPNLGRIDSPAT